MLAYQEDLTLFILALLCFGFGVSAFSMARYKVIDLPWRFLGLGSCTYGIAVWITLNSVSSSLPSTPLWVVILVRFAGVILLVLFGLGGLYPGLLKDRKALLPALFLAIVAAVSMGGGFWLYPLTIMTTLGYGLSAAALKKTAGKYPLEAVPLAILSLFQFLSGMGLAAAQYVRFTASSGFSRHALPRYLIPGALCGLLLLSCSVILARIQKRHLLKLYGPTYLRGTIRGYWFVAATAVILVAGAMLYNMQIKREYLRHADTFHAQSRILAQTIDPSSVKTLTGTVSDTLQADYQRLKAQLVAQREAIPAFRFIYLMKAKTNQVVFLVDSEPEDSADYSPLGEVYEEASDYLLAGLKGHVFFKEEYTDRWGSWMSALSPVRDRATGETLAFLGLDVDLDNWHGMVQAAGLLPLMGTLIIVLLFSSAYYRLISASIERARLEHAENRLQMALQGARLCLWSWDIETNELTFSNRFRDMLHLSGKNPPRLYPEWFALLHEADRAPVIKAIEDHLKGFSKIYESEHRLRGGDGSWIWLTARGRIVERDQQGKPLRLAGSYFDITPQKVAALKLQSMENMYRSVIENMQDVFFRADRSGNILMLSPNAGDVLAGDMNSIMGSQIRDHWVDQEAYDQLRIALRTSGNIREFETLLRRLDGSSFPATVSVSYFHDQDGDVSGIQGVMRDITEHKQAEKDLLDSKEALEQANLELKRMIDHANSLAFEAEAASIAKTQFLANMTHELRTPLNGVIGIAEVLFDCELTDEQTEYVNIVHESGKHLLFVINEIIDYTRIETGMIDMHHDTFTPRQVAADLERTLKNAARDKALDFRIELDPDAADILFYDEATRLSQLLYQPLDNAIKFTDAGSVSMHIRLIDQNERSAMVEFIITDTGIGIPQESIENMFAPFSMLDDSDTRKHRGIGLGLSICKKLVDFMGGEINMTSVPGEGTTVQIVMPLAKPKN